MTVASMSRKKKTALSLKGWGINRTKCVRNEMLRITDGGYGDPLIGIKFRKKRHGDQWE